MVIASRFQEVRKANGLCPRCGKNETEHSRCEECKMYLNLPVRSRNNYTPELIERLFAELGDIKLVAKRLGIHPASLSRIINKRFSLMDARVKGLKVHNQSV